MSQRQARDRYLEGQVLTGTPQKRRLMLIEGAIRFGRLGLECWEGEKSEEAVTALIRCRDIISELLGSVAEDQGQLATDIARIYLFLFSRLTEAQAGLDPTALKDVIRVLEIERETWRQVCDQRPSGTVDDATLHSEARTSQPPNGEQLGNLRLEA